MSKGQLDDKARNATDLAKRHADPVAERSTRSEIDAFLARAKAPGGTGRLVFAMDATLSRQPSWDNAIAQQGKMFEAVDKVGTLDVQLVYFRGLGECRASKWVSDTRSLRSLMERVDCRGGHTQIRKVLKHALRQHKDARIGGLVLIGDAMEERIDDVCALAGELGLRGVPIFAFHEGGDPTARKAFKEMARLSKGAYVPFGPGSAARLGELLAAVAAYSAGGRKALEDLGSASSRMLLEKLDT